MYNKYDEVQNTTNSSPKFALLSLFTATFFTILTIAAYAWSDSASSNTSPETMGVNDDRPFAPVENSSGDKLTVKKSSNYRTNPDVPADHNSANNPSTNKGMVIDKDHPSPDSAVGSENMR